jgi:hypothetical protein
MTTRISFYSSSRSLDGKPVATTIPSEAAILTALTDLYHPRFFIILTVFYFYTFIIILLDYCTKRLSAG